jgi:hypothetical protein
MIPFVNIIEERKSRTKKEDPKQSQEENNQNKNFLMPSDKPFDPWHDGLSVAIQLLTGGLLPLLFMPFRHINL